MPPTSPLLLTTSTTTSSVQLQWKQGDNGGAVIKGFLLSYRTENEQWEEISVDRRMSTYLLDNLLCGTKYEFRLSGDFHKNMFLYDILVQLGIYFVYSFVYS